MSREVCDQSALDTHKCKSKQRWYKIEGGAAYVYDSPYEKQATSVSIVDVSDLQYYRNKFQLLKMWGTENANTLVIS